MKYDVVIVGAGPSGSTAAKFLSEKGIKVLLVDKDKRYTLTKNGKKELEMSLNMFFETFCDVDEMRSQCECHK